MLIVLSICLVALLAVVGWFVTQYADPYVHKVLALSGTVEQGQVIFQMNCSSCHGQFGDGVVGPSLRHVSSRKSKLGLIHQVVSGATPPMPQFQPTPQEMADLLKYLESL